VLEIPVRRSGGCWSLVLVSWSGRSVLRSGRSRSPVARHLKRRIGVVAAAVLEVGVERRRIAGGVLMLSWRLDCWWCVAAVLEAGVERRRIAGGVLLLPAISGGVL
jgi:hypothetical protein